MKLFFKRILSSEKRFFMLALFLAFLIRLAYILLLEEKWYFFDTVHYDNAAQSLLQGEGFGPSLHFFNEYKYYCLEPVYPLFLALSYAIFGHVFWAVRILQALLNLTQMALLYNIAKRLEFSTAARWTIAIAAIYPYFIFISGLLYVTQLFSLLLTLIIWFALRYREKNSKLNLICTAIPAALAALANPVLFPGIPLLLLWMLWVSAGGWKKHLKDALLFMTVVLMCLTPWTLRNYYTFGVFAPGRASGTRSHHLYHISQKMRDHHTKSQTVFDGRSFTAIKRAQKGATAFDCYLDEKYLMTLVPGEPIPFDSSAHYNGLLAFGGDSMMLASARFGRQIVQSADTLMLWNVDTRNELADWEHTVGMQFQPNGISVQGSQPKWAYAAVFKKPSRVDLMQINYVDGAKPDHVRRLALLFNLNKPKLDAKGYMIWLQPMKVVDLWIVRDGRPARQLECQIYYKDLPYHKYFNIYKVVAENFTTFMTRHFLPEFINFWSPLISGVRNENYNSSLLLQIVSILSVAPLLFFALLGLWFLRNRRFFLTLVMIPILTISISYSFFFTQTRYRIPVDGFLILLAAIGIECILQRWTRRTKVLATVAKNGSADNLK